MTEIWPKGGAFSSLIRSRPFVDRYFVKFGLNWISRVHVPDGREEHVVEIPFRLAPWPFKVAPDGSLILLRERGRYDIYSLSLSVQ